jgi:signal transduction histidine kinase
MVLQIITNLVSNAVKYSPDGSVVVIGATQNGSNMQISVTDKGIGLTDSEASSLFEKFYRVDRPEVEQVGGTGLGLFITKSLVEIQGGQIWVRSTPGGGSTFAFSLPIADNGGEEIL